MTKCKCKCTSQVGPSGCLRGISFLSHNFLLLGSSRLSAWTTSLLHIHVIIRIAYSEAWFFLSLLCWWQSTLLLFSTRWSDGSCSNCSLLSDISSWMKDHHLQLNLAKTNCSWSQPSLHSPQLLCTAGSSTITPSRTTRNLGVVIDD